MAKNSSKGFYDFVPSVVAAMDRPPRILSRLITWFIMLFAFIAVAWLYLAQIEIVVSAQGTIVPAGKIKVVQSVDEGIVVDIFVQDGQLVKQGDPLIQFDTTSSVADEAQLKMKLARSKVTVQRLRMELGEEAEIGKDVIISGEVLEAERDAMESNEAAFADKVSLLELEINKNSASLGASEAEFGKLRMEVDHLNEKLNIKENQANMGLVAREQVDDIRFEIMSKKEDMTVLRQRINEQKVELETALEKITAAENDRRSKLFKELAEAEHELTSVYQEIVKAKEKISHKTLVAPVSGVVQELGINTIGGVVTRAQNLMNIVPEEMALELEAKILNKDIGFIRVDTPIKIKVDAFEFTRYGTLKGKIEWVGADAILDEQKGAIYPTRISMSELVMPNKVNDRLARVLPGMTATVDIVIGQRRLIEYFIGPILRYKDSSLRER